MKQAPVKGGTELIVYQIGEVKNIVENMSIKVDLFQEKIDKRVSALEIWKAGQEEKDRGKPSIDLTKIILAAFGIVAAAIALIQAKIIK